MEQPPFGEAAFLREIEFRKRKRLPAGRIPARQSF
jgi:hypothetical protein